MSRVLAVDPGSRRVGLAVSDPGELIAQPLRTLEAGSGLTQAVCAIAREMEVGAIVVGLPVEMSGREGPAAAAARDLGAALAGASGLPVEYVDERLTSVQAERSMAAQGLSSRRRRGRTDEVAATLILQQFLDKRRRTRA
ncbi:MAG: Holliday junction resolvase RuvX [Candidatus Dormibacteria bacterium]